MNDYDGLVGIYSNEDALTEKLAEKFSQNYLDVLVFQNFEKVKLDSLSYLIINLCGIDKDLDTLSNLLKNVECKILVIHPLYVDQSKKFFVDSSLKVLLENHPNLGVILVPDILGDKVEFNSDNLSHDLIMQSLLSERLKIDETGQLVNTISITKLSDIIMKETFSFGISGRRIALFGPRKTKKVFVSEFLGVDKENIVVKKDAWQQIELYSDASLNCDFSLKSAVKRTKNTFSLNTNRKVESQLLPKNNEINTKKIKKSNSQLIKKILKILLLTIILLLTPIYLIIMSAILLYGSSNLIFSNNNLAKTLVKGSLELSSLSKNLSFGNSFVYDSGNILHKSALLLNEGIVTANTSKSLINKMMGDLPFDLESETNNISAGLDKLHTDISFLQSEINDYRGVFANFLKSYLSNKAIDIGLYKNNLYELKNLVSRNNELFGQDRPKKYLVLFQNNMELRPTGGFIGSFALVTFSKGRLTEMVVNDVYSADGQLKGHVDAPEPIRVRLGEGGWYLRDSNWDPDFATSALKAEWFLGKEIDQQVDGVIAIDLYFIKKLIGIIGQVSLTDFNLVIDQNNLYQLIQSEVEDDFFPGSIKKASILTSLSRQLINEIRNLSTDKYLSFFKEIYQSLERKHIQIFLHDTYAQSALYNLGYTGQLDLSVECGLRCLRDSYLVVDANLGVNKSNYFISRNQELNLTIGRETSNHELFVTYNNSANPSIGNRGLYKNYVRIILPIEATVLGIRKYDLNGGYSDVSYDLIEINGRREVGFLLEVLPSAQKRIQVVWNLPSEKVAQGGQYDLKVFKQAGTDGDPLKINITTNNLSLTGKAPSSYNTTLGKNFSTRFFLK